MSDEIINNLFPTKEELEEQGIEVDEELEAREARAQHEADGLEE